MFNCLFCQEQLELIADFTDWLLSRIDNQKYICDTCLSKFEVIGDVVCPECGRKQINHNLCKDCQLWLKKDKALHLQHRAIFEYNQIAKDFFHQFKFMGDYRLKNSFDFQISQSIPPADIYISIPIAEKTLKTRGFNQVNALFSQLPIEKDILIASQKATQSHNNRRQRLTTTNPFLINQKSQVNLEGKKVVLVDDIYTTGATMRNAAVLIANQNPKSIQSFSLIR